MRWLTDPFAAPFMQRALVEVVLLAVPGGLLGAWVVLRRLAFFTHAAGTATFPALVVAGPWGLAPQLAALGAGLGFAGALERLARVRRLGQDAAVGLLLVGALALGTILAGDVYHSGAGVDRRLFGTLIALSGGDLRFSAVVAALAVAATILARRAWLAAGFDPGAARSLGVRVAAAEWLLLGLLAVTVVAALPAVGALLAGAVLVLPAATVRLVARRLAGLQLGAVALAAAEGTAGLWIAFELDVPPGPAVAVLGGLVFALTAAAGAVRRARARA